MYFTHNDVQQARITSFKYDSRLYSRLYNTRVPTWRTYIIFAVSSLSEGHVDDVYVPSSFAWQPKVYEKHITYSVV